MMNGKFNHKAKDTGHLASVEFKPGETTESAHVAKNEDDKRLREQCEEEQREIKKDENEPDLLFIAEEAEDSLRSMLKKSNPYSETFIIKSDGNIDLEKRVDGKALYLKFIETPHQLYKVAQEIERTHPDYAFKFETDPEGKWIKYTVSVEK